MNSILAKRIVVVILAVVVSILPAFENTFLNWISAIGFGVCLLLIALGAFSRQSGS